MSSLDARQERRPGKTSLIHARYTVPVRPRDVIYEGYSVAINGDEILAVLPCAEAESLWPEADVLELPEHVLIPGLINSHTHSPMTLLRGYADDMELHVWLKEHIWPAEREFVGPEFVADGTRLAIVEMLRGGTTCFNDMYFFPDATIEACLDAGMRVSVGITIIEIESAWAADVDSYVEKGLRLHEQWKSHPLISFTLSPHAPYTVSDKTLRRISALSEEWAFLCTCTCWKPNGRSSSPFSTMIFTPVVRLEQQGLLDSNLQAVHMAQISSGDIDKLAATGAHVVHCPQSNLKLASGICPLAALIEAGVNVALGTDGAASNNDLDMFAEAQTAALLAKGISGDAQAVNAFQVLEMMTINGAHALGLGNRIGSMEKGKQADLCAVDLSAPETQPLHHVVSQLIYAASRRQVSDVWVAGRRLLDSGELTSLDLDAVIRSAKKWQSRLAGLEEVLLDEVKESAL